MPVTYTNRKGHVYHLCRGRTRTGKFRFYFAREPKDTPVEELPDGYEILESINGIVSLAKCKPKLIDDRDVAAVEAAVRALPKARRYRVSVKAKQITVYEMSGGDLGEISGIFGRTLSRGFVEEMEARAQFSPIMRFTLTDDSKDTYTAERMCYRSWNDGWLKIASGQPIARLATKLIPTLGTDAFYELFYCGAGDAD